jgi:hypothetical protein
MKITVEAHMLVDAPEREQVWLLHTDLPAPPSIGALVQFLEEGVDAAVVIDVHYEVDLRSAWVSLEEMDADASVEPLESIMERLHNAGWERQ